MKSKTLFIAALFVMGATGAMPTRAQDDQRTYPSGPKTCKSGYVWRNAFAGDAACVAPSQRGQAAADNAAAAQRVVPGSAQCRSPYVWRVARASDLVCVTTATRARVADDNRLAYSRLASTHVTPTRPRPPSGPVDIPDPRRPAGGVESCRVTMVCPPNWSLGLNVGGHCECMLKEPGAP